MMARKQLLHELLKQDQEPFHLHTYISDRRSQLQKPSPPSSSATTKLRVRKRKSCSINSFSRHACFFSLHNSPDVLRKSPFRDFPKSPAKSPAAAAVLLHVPAGIAAHLVEAALRIQKQHQPKPKSENLRFGMFGSFLKRLKDRSRNKNRAIKNDDFRKNVESRRHEEESVRVSTCSNRRLSSADWTDNNEDKSMDFEASTSGYGSDCSEDDIISDFDLPESRYCASPFVFSFHRSPSSTGRRTPDFCSPVCSPARSMKKEKESYHQSQISGGVLGQEDEHKEQCSPVSVLDPPFEDDDGRESGDAHLDDYDLECSYANVQRAKEQLLHRLRRFEKLAELDPLELDEKLVEASDIEDEEAEDDDPLHCVFATQVSDRCSHYLDMSPDLTSDEVICSDDKRLDLWKEAEVNMIEMKIRLDLTEEERDEWKRFRVQSEDTAADIELAIFGVLVEELMEELLGN